jgi:hypothetical protein
MKVTAICANTIEQIVLYNENCYTSTFRELTNTTTSTPRLMTTRNNQPKTSRHKGGGKGMEVGPGGSVGGELLLRGK